MFIRPVISLSSLVLDSFQHITHSLPYSFWPFIIFPCPTAFRSLSCSFVFSSFSLFSFLHHLLSCWVIKDVSHSSKSFICPSSHLKFYTSLFPKLAWMDTARAMPWLYSLASEFFCSCVSYSDCCSNLVSQVKDFPGVPEREAGDGYVPLVVARM